MSITGQPDEAPGGGPVKVGVALVDILTGLYATIGIQAALRHRERTGRGSRSIWPCSTCRWRCWPTRR